VGEQWKERVSRAAHLASANDGVASLLDFYGVVLKWQSDVDCRLRAGAHGRPTRSLEQDVADLRPEVVTLLRTVGARAPQPLAAEAAALLDDPAAIDAALLTWWHEPSDRRFIPKASLQPYAQWLVEMRTTIRRVTPAAGEARCPHCGGAPQLSILRGAGNENGGGRLLLCSTCVTPWPFRRVLCASCGEEDERQLGYYYSPPLDHVRVDVCETCRRYLKTIDLTRLGTAIPIVDEVAAAPLDVWARERGYEKIELNLLGI
jgi:FdhE protein